MQALLYFNKYKTVYTQYIEDIKNEEEEEE
jgi:hypothetical protein